MLQGSDIVRSEDVLNRFRLGDLDAFESLFREHQRSVYGWILRIVRDTAAAEDLMVETFWRIHRAHARFEPARSFEPWARFNLPAPYSVRAPFSGAAETRPKIQSSC